MVKRVFKISGMHCPSCAASIDLDLEEQSGVKSSNTSYSKSETIIEFDDKKISDRILKSVIAKTGYKVVD